MYKPSSMILLSVLGAHMWRRNRRKPNLFDYMQDVWWYSSVCEIQDSLNTVHQLVEAEIAATDIAY